MPTELVHEGLLKLMPLERVEWRDRAHFFAIASRAMRNVLVDHAVRRGAVKRGSGAIDLVLEEQSAATEHTLDDLIALGLALDKLERLDARQVQVVECRFFGGLSLDETAEALGISAANREQGMDLRVPGSLCREPARSPSRRPRSGRPWGH